MLYYAGDVLDTIRFLWNVFGATCLGLYTFSNGLAASPFIAPLFGLVFEIIWLTVSLFGLFRYPIVLLPTLLGALYRFIGLKSIYGQVQQKSAWTLFHWKPDLILAWYLYGYLVLVLRWTYLLVQIYALDKHRVAEPSDRGEVTAVISVNARPNGHVNECIRSLQTQCAQVIVLTDDTDIFNADIERWQANPNIRFLRVQSTAPHIRLCVGLQVVETRYLLLVSPPCSFPPQAVELLLGPMTDTTIGAVATGQRATPFGYRMPPGAEPERPRRGRLARSIPDGLQINEEASEHSGNTLAVNVDAESMYGHGRSATARAVYHGGGFTHATRSERGDPGDQIEDNYRPWDDDSWTRIRNYLEGLARAGSYLGIGSGTTLTTVEPREVVRPRSTRLLRPRKPKTRIPQVAVRAAQAEIHQGRLDPRLLNFTSSKVKSFRGAPYYGPPPRSPRRFIFYPDRDHRTSILDYFFLVFVVIKDGMQGTLQIIGILLYLLTLGLFRTITHFLKFLGRNIERFHARFFHLVAAIIPHQHEAINKLSLALHGTAYILPRRATLFRTQILQDPTFIRALRDLKEEFPRDCQYFPTLPGDEEVESYFITRSLVDRGWRMAIQDTGACTVEIPVETRGFLTATHNLAGARSAEWRNLRFSQGRIDALAFLETLARMMDVGFVVDPFLFAASLNIFGLRLGIIHWILIALSRIFMSGFWKELFYGSIEGPDLWVMPFLLWWSYWSDIVSASMFFASLSVVLDSVPALVGRLSGLLWAFIRNGIRAVIYIFR